MKGFFSCGTAACGSGYKEGDVPFSLRKLNFEGTESTFQCILKDQERISAMRIAEKYTSSETQGQLVGSIKCSWWKFTVRFINPTNCPWVSKDKKYKQFPQRVFTYFIIAWLLIETLLFCSSSDFSVHIFVFLKLFIHQIRNEFPLYWADCPEIKTLFNP